MFSAVSGLQSDSNWLDVIGNNISNTNTVGYKSSRVGFADQYSQSLFGGSGDNTSNGLGGVNPMEVGLGTRLESIETLFTQGVTQSTGNPLDVSIQGNGFLLAKQDGNTYLTRSGVLSFDSQGYLTDQNGGLIQGYSSSLQEQTTVINSFSNIPGSPAVTISSSLVVDSSNPTSISNIQISNNLVLPAKPTTEIDFQGNLDSLQQAANPGGILDMAPGGQPVLPIAWNAYFFPPGIAMDSTRLVPTVIPGGGYPNFGQDFAFQQVSNLSATVAFPILNGGIDLAGMIGLGGNYAWEQQPPMPPADQAAIQVYDSLGNPRQITLQFYQIDDLGGGGVNNPAGPNQVCYAWYAFDTTGGVPVKTSNLLGGTGIVEGEQLPPFNSWVYDRGIPNNIYMGDFVWFNTDGSLATTGGSGGPDNTPPGVPNFMTVPRLYLPPFNTNPATSPLPTQGAGIDAISLNFGAFGVLGTGRRNGLYSDAEGSYQIVNGISTYVPKSTAAAVSQNGYPDGLLQSMDFQEDGVLMGSFSNGQKTALAQVALANVENAEGLDKVGSNYFSTSTNTGEFILGVAGKNGFGLVQGGTLERSNVDLSTEMVSLIQAQRSFNSNARAMASTVETMSTQEKLGQQ